LRQIDATINDINYVRTQQSSQVSSLNATIGQLERAVSEGYRE
jgi:outer membrane murein-binding lipoprotein Lpp